MYSCAKLCSGLECWLAESRSCLLTRIPEFHRIPPGTQRVAMGPDCDLRFFWSRVPQFVGRSTNATASPWRSHGLTANQKSAMRTMDSRQSFCLVLGLCIVFKVTVAILPSSFLWQPCCSHHFI
jgi:hypothetical protein